MASDGVQDDEILSFFSSPGSLSPPPTDDRLARQRLEVYAPKAEDDNTMRILASFLDFLSDEGRHPLSQFISDCSDATLYNLAQHLLSFILVPMRASAVTPELSPSPFEDNEAQVQEVASTMDQPPTRNKQEQLKQQCLDRDDHRCMATSIIDANADGIGTVRHGLTASTELAHIIPYSVGMWEDKKTDYKIAQMWATLRRLFPRIRLGPTEINDPRNLMTLFSEVHRAFGQFCLAFEPTENNNEYKILTLGSRFPTILTRDLPPPNHHGYRLVTFQAHTNMALPSPAILQAHAALANILHASGLGEHIEKIIRDFEETRSLAQDGGTDIHRLLSIRLHA